MFRESQVTLELLLLEDLFGINELHAKYTPVSVKRNAKDNVKSGIDRGTGSASA